MYYLFINRRATVPVGYEKRLDRLKVLADRDYAVWIIRSDRTTRSSLNIVAERADESARFPLQVAQ